jgi:hypothetical protein
MSLRDDDIEAGVTADERAVLASIAERIEHDRPVPAASFRGDLRRRLDASGLGMPALRRRRLALCCLIGGGAMLGLAAIGLTGLGPLAPDVAGDAVAWVRSIS